MIPALFLGRSPYLRMAFPNSLREELARICDFPEEDIPENGWHARKDELARAKVIFSTWGMPKLDEEFLAAAPSLEAVFYAAGSIRAFATDESYGRGIVISSSWAANAVPVSEYTLATILLSLKQFWAHARNTRENISGGLDVCGAYGAKVGLVSLGAIGKLVARRLGSFELDLIAHDPFVDPESAQELDVSLVSLEELFRVSDVVSLHTPWLPETEGLITGDLVRSMKHGATLINTSRGAVVNEPELCEVLRERPDLTAVLDVTWPEPPAPDSPLRTLPNVVLTPHIAGSMGREIERMGRWMIDEFFRYHSGSPLKHSISPAMLKRMA